MEHESFEDPEIAALMNENFVCVKVDREERPDVDAIYMEAVQTMTGQGGWPLNVFLTPDQAPFFGGTYFPPEPRHGLPSWPQVLEARRRGLARAPRRRRRRRPRSSRRGSLGARRGSSRRPSRSTTALLDDGGRRACAASYDARNGGFGGAPKFPPASTIEFLLAPRRDARCRCARSARWPRGGIYDQVGGGFARYAVDATWTVPHFEKMLYDNALLARAYLHGWQVTGDELLLRDVLRRRSTRACASCAAPEGGFYAALDADSEGVEGRFYVWTLAELRDVARRRWPTPAIAYFGATDAGNFEGAQRARGPRARARADRARDPRARCSTRRAAAASARRSTTSG